jgi:magnesium-transporting ATPase (P-type)
MKDFLKLFLLLLAVGFVNVCAFCMVASVFLKQPDGIFWYGVGMIVFGVPIRLMVKHWF